MKQKLKTIIEELQNASKMHLRQSKELEKMESPANKNGITVGENTGEVQEDKKGKYVLRSEESVAGQKGDTLRIKNPKLINTINGLKDFAYLKGGDYKTEKLGDKNYNISPVNHQIPHKHSDGSKHGYVKPPTSRNKFGGTPDNTDKQAAYEKAQDQLFAEGKITETDDKAVKLIEKRVKKNAKKLSK